MIALWIRPRRLDVDQAHVVSGSIGTVWALQLAAAHPSRVGRIVLMGGGPLLPEIRMPAFIRLLVTTIGAIMVRAIVSWRGWRPGLTFKEASTPIGHGG